MSRGPLTAAVVAAVLALVPSVTAGVIVVDPANGPGTSFVSLHSAIRAAAAGDVLLLRSGTHVGAFDLGALPVSLVADENAIVELRHPPVPLRGVPATLAAAPEGPGDVVLRGVHVSVPPHTGAFGILLSSFSTRGRTHVEECGAASGANAGMLVEGFREVLLARCELRGSDAVLGAKPASPQPGLRIAFSPVATFGGAVTGGSGATAAPGLAPGAQHGAPGAWVNADGFHVHLAGVHLQGGHGGSGSTCGSEGNGGFGAVNFSGLALHATGVSGAGGLAGAPAAGCTPMGSAGTLLGNAALGNPPIVLPGSPAELRLPRVRRAGELARVRVQGHAGDAAWLVLGAAPAFAYLPSASGVLAVQPQLVLPLGKLPASGTLSVSGHAPPVPPGASHAFLHAQVVTRDAKGQTVMGSPSAMLVLP